MPIRFTEGLTNKAVMGVPNINAIIPMWSSFSYKASLVTS